MIKNMAFLLNAFVFRGDVDMVFLIHYIKFFILLVSSGLAVVSCSSYPDLPEGDAGDRDARIKKYLDALIAEDRFPGIQYMVLDQKGVLFEYAVGNAVIDKVPMTLKSPMMIYSATKVITAAAILKLVDQGRLTLDDTLEQYLPSIPYPGISLRHVLTHSSGIPNPIMGNFYVHSEAEVGTFDKQSLLKDVLRDNPGLQFPAGSDFDYSNLGYALLGEVIESVSNKSYEQYIEEEILKPLMIENNQASFTFNTFSSESRGYVQKFSIFNAIASFMLEGFTSQIQGRWKTYKEHWYFNYPAHGGLISNAPSVSIFLRDQLSTRSKLMSQTQKKEFYRIQKPAESSPMRSTDIAIAWFVNRDAYEMYYFHEGSAFGYVTEMRIYPESAIASVLLVNATKIPHKNLMDMIDAQFQN